VISVFLLWLRVTWVLVMGNSATVDMGCVASVSESLCPSWLGNDYTMALASSCRWLHVMPLE